jgi:class 3 adenylate cyclase
MPTGQLLHLDRRLAAEPRPAGADGIVLGPVSAAPPPARTLCVYIDERDASRLAELIAPAQLVELGRSRAVVLPSPAATAPPSAVARPHEGRFLTTVLMTDIVDSTCTVARLGDRAWGEFLAGHYDDCRAVVTYAGGELVDTTGDGIVAIFDGPTHAVGAAIAIQETAREHGVGVRAGVHCGECERIPQTVTGVAVHIAARVCALGAADEVLTTATVRDLAAGSTLAFEPCGVRTLRGVPGEWALFRAGEAG